MKSTAYKKKCLKNKQDINFKKEKFVNILKTIVKCWPLLIVFPYFLGFIFTQGKFSFVSKRFLPWQLIFNTIVPVSFDHYLINGIFYLFRLLMHISVSIFLYLCFRYLRHLWFEYFKKDSSTNKLFSSNNEWFVALYRYILFSLSIVSLFFYIIFFTICIQNGLHESKNFATWNSIALIMQLLVYIIFSDQILASDFIKTTKTNIHYSEYKLQNLFFKVIATIFIFLSFSCSVYYDGLINELIQLSNFSNNTNATPNSVKVLFDGSSEHYYYIEANDQFLIAYNTSNNTLTMIPKLEIEKLEIMPLKAADEKPLYKAQELSYNENAAIQTVQNFYTYKKELSINLLKNLISSSFNGPTEYLYPSEVLKERWNKEESDNYLIDYELSLPEYNESSKNCIVYVIEYWLNENVYLEYHLLHEDNEWKIDNIKTSTPSFKFIYE